MVVEPLPVPKKHVASGDNTFDSVDALNKDISP